jgi:hypothetical protein
MDLGGGDAVDRFDLRLHLLGEGLGDRAHRGGQGHVDVHVVPLADVDLVDQAELENVDRDFRVVDRAQRFDHTLAQLVDLCLAISVRRVG